MDTEFNVLAAKLVKYLNNAVIVSRLCHWNVRGHCFYEYHLLFERVYSDLAAQQDAASELLRACGFNLTFDLFAGPGIDFPEPRDTVCVELTLDYVMTLSGVTTLFYNFCEENSNQPQLVALGDYLQSLSSVCLQTSYLLQSSLGY